MVISIRNSSSSVLCLRVKGLAGRDSCAADAIISSRLTVMVAFHLHLSSSWWGRTAYACSQSGFPELKAHKAGASRAQHTVH